MADTAIDPDNLPAPIERFLILSTGVAGLTVEGSSPDLTAATMMYSVIHDRYAEDGTLSWEPVHDGTNPSIVFDTHGNFTDAPPGMFTERLVLIDLGRAARIKGCRDDV